MGGAVEVVSLAGCCGMGRGLLSHEAENFASHAKLFDCPGLTIFQTDGFQLFGQRATPVVRRPQRFSLAVIFRPPY